MTSLIIVSGALCAVGFVRALSLPTRDRVITLLKKHAIDYKSWGHDGRSNNLDTLVECVDSGEVWLESHPDNILIQHVNVAVATIVHSRGHEALMLREFRHGQPRRFSGSIGEKIKFEERRHPELTVTRGFKEELGETEPGFCDNTKFTLRPLGVEVTDPKPSDFYPGLFDVYHRHHFGCTIDPSLYHTTYHAHDNGHEIVFKWVQQE